MSLYGVARFLLRLLLPLRVRVAVEGVEHVPAEGAFVLVLNHQSVLDPILAQVACPRTVHSMTKSTQFRGRIWRWLLVRLAAFPTRRYRVDPQAVRTALRLLGEGKGVGIYPEGERSWDGRLQPLREGSVRLLLKAGVPVVPCGISGSYDVLPRWGRSLRPGTVRVRFGEPVLFGRHDTRADRDAVLPAALRRVEWLLRSLSGASGPMGELDAGGRASGAGTDAGEGAR